MGRCLNAECMVCLHKKSKTTSRFKRKLKSVVVGDDIIIVELNKRGLSVIIGYS